jgi:hypothetical protein
MKTGQAHRISVISVWKTFESSHLVDQTGNMAYKIKMEMGCKCWKWTDAAHLKLYAFTSFGISTN